VEIQSLQTTQSDIPQMKKFRIPLIIVTIILTAFMLRGKIPHEKFNSEKWKTANLNLEENMTLRWDMMNDLRNRYKLVGMTKKQVIELLGSNGDNTGSEFSYYLGYSKTGINTGRLTITFNNKDIVTEIHVWEG
jgi:hypothetical protein